MTHNPRRSRAVAVARWHRSYPIHARPCAFSQGDPHTTIPTGNNEGLTNAYSHNITSRWSPAARTEGRVGLEVSGRTSIHPDGLKLRPNVKFHDGSPFNADDVVFSIQRALSDTSNFKPYLAGVKEARKVDDLTVDVITTGPAPVLIPQFTEVRMMSKSWATKHNVLKPQD